MVPLYGPLGKISSIPTRFLFCHKAKFTRMKEHKEHSNKSFVGYKHNGELKEFQLSSPLLSSYVHFFLCIFISQNSFPSPFLFMVFFFHCCGLLFYILNLLQHHATIFATTHFFSTCNNATCFASPCLLQ